MAADLNIADGFVQLSFLVQGVLADAAAVHDLTVPQVRLLGIVRDRQPSMRELAHHLRLDKSSVTGLIDRAERRGLVQRAADAADGRGVRVSPTTLGRRLTRQVAAEIEAELDRLAAGLSAADRRTLTQLMSQVVAANQPDVAG
jgi:MarR family transcriptional regulator, lower aerobic nicotinate degradation pathway regulator